MGYIETCVTGCKHGPLVQLDSPYNDGDDRIWGSILWALYLGRLPCIYIYIYKHTSIHIDM